MGKNTKIINISTQEQSAGRGQSEVDPIVAALMNSMSDIDEQLDNHLNSSITKVTNQ